MSVQFVKETVFSCQMLRAVPQQAAVEAEVLLPGGLRDEVRILYTDATVVPVVCEGTGNRVTVSGHVDFKALYAQGDLTRVKVAEVSQDFSRTLNAESSCENVRFTPACEVTQIASRVFNGRLLLKADVNIYAEAVVSQEVSVVSSVKEKDAEALEKYLKIRRVVGEGIAQGLIRGEFEISEALNASEVLFAGAQVRVEDIVGGADGRAAVTGNIDLSVCFSSTIPGRPVVVSTHAMPFEQTVTLSGEIGDLMSAAAFVTDAAAALEGDETGKILRAEVGLQVKLEAIGEQEISLLTDVFSTDAGEITAEDEPVSFCTALLNEQSAESGRVQVMLPEGAPRIKTILAAFAKPVLAGAKEMGGRLNVDLLLRTTLLYMTEDSGIPLSYTCEEPMRLSFPCEAQAEDMLSLTASHVEASAIAGDRAEIRCVVGLCASGVRCEKVTVLKNVAREENSEPLRCLAMYVTQPGERLWDVMKRYRLPETSVKSFNEHISAYAPESVLPLSTRLIVYKR
ncbi:MAG: DUF3794 domain-containing protein [Clostridia bacterium]|nr:DUF3794 domain-containing protein [Clostridia bacterium]